MDFPSDHRPNAGMDKLCGQGGPSPGISPGVSSLLSTRAKASFISLFCFTTIGILFVPNGSVDSSLYLYAQYKPGPLHNYTFTGKGHVSPLLPVPGSPGALVYTVADLSKNHTSRIPDLVSGTWAEEALSRPFSPHSVLYKQIGEHIVKTGTFPFHLVDRGQLYKHIADIPNMQRNAKYGGPYKHLPGMKNPCWIEGRNPGGGQGNFTRMVPGDTLHCLPYFFLAGVGKCGTTSLFAKLSNHPQIVPPGKKEPYFWATLQRPSLSRYTTNIFRGIINKLAPTLRSGKQSNVLHRFISGDGDPGTVWRSTTIKPRGGVVNPKYITPLPILSLNPQARVIVLCRNPTERAYSHYRHFSKRSTQSAKHFHSYMTSVVKQAKTIISKYGLRTFVHSYSKRSAFGALSGGLYYAYLRDWFNLFGGRNILVVPSDDYYRTPVIAFKSITDFLEIDAFDSSYHAFLAEAKTKKFIKKRQKRHVGRMPKTTDKMLPETKKLLDEFYKPFNIMLADFLQNEIYLSWSKGTYNN